jgi:hypothetical protein
MKSDDNGNYFLIYVNYPVINNKEKHIEFFNNKNSITKVWGANITVRYLQQKFDLGSDKIENKRHKVFESVLTQIANGTPLREIDGMGNIIDEVNKNKPIKTFRVETNKRGTDIIVEREIWGLLTHKNEGDRLYHLACHSLVYFLKVRDSIKRLKQCPYCKIFFIAKDTKKDFCYSNECFKEYKKLQKQNQREVDPEKYI